MNNRYPVLIYSPPLGVNYSNIDSPVGPHHTFPGGVDHSVRGVSFHRGVLGVDPYCSITSPTVPGPAGPLYIALCSAAAALSIPSPRPFRPAGPYAGPSCLLGGRGVPRLGECWECVQAWDSGINALDDQRHNRE